MNEPRLNLPELTVSELSASLKRTVEDTYGDLAGVRGRGEVYRVTEARIPQGTPISRSRTKAPRSMR